MKKIFEYKVGDRLVIKEKPYYWTSLCSDKNPLEHNISYPYSCVIVDIKYIGGEYEHYGIRDGNDYGWDLNVLIDNNLLYDIKKIRYNKLFNINKL